jgi:hypothetical protein
MPTVTLTFRLPKEKVEMHQSLQGENYYSIISEADNHLRAFVKYREGQSADALQLADEVRSILREALLQ